MERDLSKDQSTARAAVRVQRHINPLLIAGVAVFAALSFYAAIVVATQLDHRVALTNRVPDIAIVSSLPGVDQDCTSEQTADDERTNILVMGLDLRRDEDPDIAARTDTVFVLTIDECDKRAAVLSIPRDLAVDIPVSLGGDEGYFTDRVNTAYVYGENQNKGDGPKYAVEAVETSFDIPIDHYAVLNFNNFIDIVDELGGIDIVVPEYVWDPEYSDCNSCGAWYVEFEEGPQHMDGETALTYARLRHSDNDFKRIERQQLVMRAIAKRASDIGVLVGSNPQNLWNSYKQSVKTDIGDTKLIGLALLGSEIGVDTILMESFSEAVYACPVSQCNGAAILLPIPSKIEEVKGRVFGDGKLQQEAAAIKVVNGTPTPKLGETFAGFLRSEGVASDRITVDEYANGELFDQTLIIVHGEFDYTPGRIAEWLGFDDSRVLKFDTLSAATQARWADPTVGITVVIGADAVVPEAPDTVSDYTSDSDTYYAPGDSTDVAEEYVEPVETAAPEPVPVTPEPTPEPAPEVTPEPTAEPPPETPPAGG